MDDNHFGPVTLVPVENGRLNQINYSGAPIRVQSSLAADVRDAELEILQHDAAGQLEELENMQKQLGIQQARLDYLEGSNSQLCIELEAANSHHQELVMQLRQSIDTSNRERDFAQAREQEIATENAALAARIQYVDKNMSDLEFLLEHAVQREEKALQREKQALATLHQTQKSSENALGQGLPHEVEMLHRHLNAAEQHCNALDSISRRCLFAAQAKDALVEKLRAQLDASEEQLQKLLVCTAEELDTVRTQVRKSAEIGKDDERSKTESIKTGSTELLRMYDEQLKEANRKIAELERSQTITTLPDIEKAPTNLGLIQMHEEQQALLVMYEKQLNVANTRVEELENELVKLKLSSNANVGSAAESSSGLDGLYAALEKSQQKQREAEERAQILAEEKRTLALAKQQLVMTQEIEAKELREKRMRQVISRLMGKNVQWAFDCWCEAMEDKEEPALLRIDSTHSKQQDSATSTQQAQQTAVGKEYAATGDSQVKSFKRQSIVQEGEELTTVLARRREMGEMGDSVNPKDTGPTQQGTVKPTALDSMPDVHGAEHVSVPLPHNSPIRVSLPLPPESAGSSAQHISDPGAQITSYVFGNGTRPIPSTFANVRPSFLTPRRTAVGDELLDIGVGKEVSDELLDIGVGKEVYWCRQGGGVQDSAKQSTRLAQLLERANREVGGGGDDVLSDVISMVEESCRNLEILPDVGDLAMKLVRGAGLEAARFQDELLSKEYEVRTLQANLQRLDAHTVIISDLQQSLMQAIEREEILKSNLDEHISHTDCITLELEKLTTTIAMLEKELSEGPNARIAALEDALQEAERSLSNNEARANADQDMLKDVLKSLMARDEEIAGVRSELEALRSSLRASVVASRQSIARDLNLSMPLALEKNGIEKRQSRGHISSIDIDMIYSRTILAPAQGRAGAELHSSREPGPVETRVLDGDASAYEDVVGAYHRAAVYRQHVKGNNNVSSAGKELSDLEIFERRLMGYDASPEKNNPEDNISSTGRSGAVEDEPKSMEERERELEEQRQKEWDAVAEKARAAEEERERERELSVRQGAHAPQLDAGSMVHETEASSADAGEHVGDERDTQQGQDNVTTSQQQMAKTVDQDEPPSASPSLHTLATAVSEFVAPFHPFKAPSKLPKKIFEKFDAAHASVRPNNFQGSGLGADQVQTVHPHRPASPEEEYEHAFACEYNCGFHSESFAECSEHEATCALKPAEAANKTSPSNVAPTPSVTSTGSRADIPSPVNSQVKALVEAQKRLDGAAKQAAGAQPAQPAVRSEAISRDGERDAEGSNGHRKGDANGGRGDDGGRGREGVGADDLPPPQSTLRDLANQDDSGVERQDGGTGTNIVGDRPKEKKRTKKSSKKSSPRADNLTDPSLYGPMVQNFMSKQQQISKQQESDLDGQAAVQGASQQPASSSNTRAQPTNSPPEKSKERNKLSNWFGLGKKTPPSP